MFSRAREKRWLHRPKPKRYAVLEQERNLRHHIGEHIFSAQVPELGPNEFETLRLKSSEANVSRPESNSKEAFVSAFSVNEVEYHELEYHETEAATERKGFAKLLTAAQNVAWKDYIPSICRPKSDNDVVDEIQPQPISHTSNIEATLETSPLKAKPEKLMIDTGVSTAIDDFHFAVPSFLDQCCHHLIDLMLNPEAVNFWINEVDKSKYAVRMVQAQLSLNPPSLPYKFAKYKPLLECSILDCIELLSQWMSKESMFRLSADNIVDCWEFYEANYATKSFVSPFSIAVVGNAQVTKIPDWMLHIDLAISQQYNQRDEAMIVNMDVDTLNNVYPTIPVMDLVIYLRRFLVTVCPLHTQHALIYSLMSLHRMTLLFERSMDLDNFVRMSAGHLVMSHVVCCELVASKFSFMLTADRQVAKCHSKKLLTLILIYLPQILKYKIAE